MASLPPRIHGFGDLSEIFRLSEDGKYNQYDAYLVASRRIESRALATGEGLAGLRHELQAFAQFMPGRTYPHPGAKPQGVQVCGTPLTVVEGPPWATVQTTTPLVVGWDEAVRWKVPADDGVLACEVEGPAFPDPYVWTRVPPTLPVASTFDVEAVVERAIAGGSGLPPAELLSLSVTFHMPGEALPAAKHSIRHVYPGPIDGDMYVFATRLEKLFDDRPPYYAPGSAAAVVRAIRRTEVIVKAEGEAARDQRWCLAAVVEAEVPVEWRAD